MPFLAILPILAAAAPAPITVTGQAWAPFISPMGEPFRSRGPDDNTLADWFNGADRNHDGVLTADEMEADAARFFATLDTDHNGEIDPDELAHYEWQVAPEIQVNSRRRRARGEAAPVKADEHGKRRSHDSGYLSDGPEGAGRYALLNIPEPVASADADFNRGVTLAEFKQAALARFQLLDRNHQGRVSLAELQAMLPPPPTPGRKAKRPKNAVDTRVGLPLPADDQDGPDGS